MGRTRAARRLARAAGGRGRHGVPRARRRLRPEAVLPVLRRAGERVHRGRRRPASRPRSSWAVEALPVEDGAFDLVLCTQVLEHCDDPVRRLSSELRRVTAPGGRVLASTHGVQVYHPSPKDYWRWTHAGLERLFDGERRVGVGRGDARRGDGDMSRDAARDLYRDRLAAHVLARAPVWLLNRTGSALDRAGRSLREPRPGSLTANFHLVAKVAGPS